MNRKNGRKFTKILAGVTICSFLLTGCGGLAETKGTDYNGGYAMEAVTTESEYDSISDAGISTSTTATQITEENSASQKSNRKLIRTVDLEVETKQFDDIIADVNEKVRELGGYIEDMNTFNGSTYRKSSKGRSSNMTLRIPKDRADEFLDMISGASNVIRRSENMKDVTLNYVDMKSHKEALQTEYDRLLVLLEQAEELEDIIVLENRLSDVRYQIESMESQLRAYDDKVDYTTITLRVDEVEELTPVVEEEESFWQRISEGFLDNLNDVVEGGKEFIIWFISSLPKLLVWGIIIAVIVLIIKGFAKKKAMKKKNKAVLVKNDNAGNNVTTNGNAGSDPDKGEPTDHKSNN